MKILLISPSNTIAEDSIRRIQEPLGLLYIATILKQKGHKIKIIDSTCEGYYNTISKSNGYITYGLSDEDIKNKIKSFNPDVVGITSMFTSHQDSAIHHARLVRQVSKAPIIFGGIHSSMFAKETISNTEVDYVIIGEGEYRFPKLLECIKTKSYPDFDGIAYKKHGKIIINPMTTRIEDLDELPIPDRSLIDFEKYIEINVPFAPFARKSRVANVVTSRGCPGNCNFCAGVKYWGRKWRKRSVDNIMKEIDDLVKNYGIQEIQFGDDNMTIDKTRAMELFERMKTYNLSWCTPNGLFVGSLDEELIDKMGESGAYQLTFAIESGSKRVREKIIHKAVPPRKRVKELIDKCHKNNIQVHGMFIIGHIGETKPEAIQTINYPYEVGFDSISIFILNPLPGSEVYDECKSKGYLIKNPRVDFKSSDILIPKDSPDFLMTPEEIVKFVDDATRMYKTHIQKIRPEIWETKFKNFLKKHGDKSDIILGRVT